MKRDEFVELLVGRVKNTIDTNRELDEDDVNSLTDEIGYEDVVTDIVGAEEPEEDEHEEDPEVAEPDTDR
jgi:hypothetical protein